MAEVAGHALAGHSLAQLPVAVHKGQRGVAAQTEAPRLLASLLERLHVGGVEHRVGEGEGVQTVLPRVINVHVAGAANPGTREPARGDRALNGAPAGLWRRRGWGGGSLFWRLPPPGR